MSRVMEYKLIKQIDEVSLYT